MYIYIYTYICLYVCMCMRIFTYMQHIQDNFHEKVRNFVCELLHLLNLYSKRKAQHSASLSLCRGHKKQRAALERQSQSDWITTSLRAGAADRVHREPQTLVAIALPSQCVAVLQCATVCCSVLQCVAVCCSVLQCVAVYDCSNHARKPSR